MSNHLKFLILEDNPFDVEMLQRLLNKSYPGNELKIVMSENDYVQSLETFRPDVILADNSLPQFNATAALRILKERKEEIPFILITGTVSEEFAAETIRAGADDYILKDRLTRLPSAIDRAIQLHQTRRDQQAALQKVIEREVAYRTLIERITDAFISLDKEWNYRYLNRQVGELLQTDPDSLLGKNIWEVFPDAVGSATYNAMHQAMSEQHYVTNVDYYAPLDLWQENHIYPSEDGITMFIRDITEKKKLEYELLDQQRNENLRLTATVLEAQEKERNAIGIELHDNVNQILASTRLLLSMIKLPQGNGQELIDSCMENLQAAIDENRKISHRMVSPDLDTKSLFDQLQQLVKTMLEPSGINTKLSYAVEDENLLPADFKLTIYRIAQEQCNNIIKHSHAKNVELQINTNANQFSMVICDDGEGSNPEKLTEGIGLRNIKGRLSIFKGSLTISTTPGNGFRLGIDIPRPMVNKKNLIV